MKISNLRRNTVIIAISNLGSKAISFVLAPLYSYCLSTEEYGQMDMITTVVSLMVPLICFDIYEATFRFANDNDLSDEKVISSSLAVCSIGIIIVLIFLGINWIASGNSIITYVCLYTIFDTVNNVFTQFERGKNRINIYAVSGVINSICILLFNIIFMFLLHLQLRGWLISFLLAKFVVLIFFILKKDIRVFSFSLVDKELIRQFMKFCLPLIPTAMMWWTMNISDRLVIIYFIGSSAAGIYAVANKIPNLLSIFENIFYQAWQTTAIQARKDSKRDEFYSTVFNKYVTLLVIGICMVFQLIRPVIRLFADDYESAWYCVPPLLIGVIFHALGSILGSFYTVFKNTKGALITSSAGAVTNIILNVFLVPIAGIMGASITTLVGFIVTFIYRFFDTRQFVLIKIEKRKIILYISLLVMQTLLFYLNYIIFDVCNVCLTIIILYVNRKFLRGLINNKLLNMRRHKKI